MTNLLAYSKLINIGEGSGFTTGTLNLAGQLVGDFKPLLIVCLAVAIGGLLIALFSGFVRSTK